MSLKAEKQIEGLGLFFVEVGDFNLKWIYGMTKWTNLISGNVSRHSQEPKSFTCFDLIKEILKFLWGTFTSFFARFSLLHTNFFLLNCLAAYHNEVKPVLAAVLSALMKGPWSRRCFQSADPTNALLPAHPAFSAGLWWLQLVRIVNRWPKTYPWESNVTWPCLEGSTYVLFFTVMYFDVCLYADIVDNINGSLGVIRKRRASNSEHEEESWSYCGGTYETVLNKNIPRVFSCIHPGTLLHWILIIYTKFQPDTNKYSLCIKQKWCISYM